VVGPPQSVAIAPDESIALVAASTKIDPSDPKKTAPDNRLSVIDLKASPPAVIATLELGSSPAGVSFSPDGKLALVTNRGEGTVSRYFAVALAPRGITVNAVSPGLTDDSVLQSFGDAAVDIARKWHGSGWTPMGRMGTPTDIGNAVSLLCSPDASWITGQLIYADGGASLVDTLLPLEIQRG